MAGKRTIRKPRKRYNSSRSNIDSYFPGAKNNWFLPFGAGVSAKSDKFSNADVEYQIEGTSTWTKAGTLSDKGDQTISFGNVANVKAVRIHNNTVTGGWVRIGEIEILSPANEDTSGARAGFIRTLIQISLQVWRKAEFH